MNVYRTTFALTAIAVAGGTAMTVVDLLDGTINGIGLIGLAVILAATVVAANVVNAHLVKATNRPADDAYEIGYEMGYNAGWNVANAGEPVVDLKAV